MGSAADRLLSLVETEGAFDTPHDELLPLQLAAANERLEQRIGRIRLLANRAESAAIRAIRAPQDLVPLLFAHTAYKSYAESWLAEGSWARMGRWLETVSAYPVQGLELEGIKTLDDWLERLETVGHYVTCSSGTTGKPALLTCSKRELDLTGRITIRSLSWALDIEPAGDFKMMGMGGALKAARAEAIRVAITEAFCASAFQLPGPPITVGQIAGMIALRRKLADGTAQPAEIAAFESISASRQTALDASKEAGVSELIGSRDRKMLISGMWATLYSFAEAVRARGYGGGDFSAQNILLVAGGLKGASLPPNYKEYIFETFNLEPRRVFHLYSMQEINSQFPLCGAGRYHVPAWVMLLLLSENGEELLDTSGGGEIEGRAAFFDISLDARWGGIISGDKIKASYGRCACGSHGPTVAQEIVRYADLVSGDKLTCAGTIDAYVRGVT